MCVSAVPWDSWLVAGSLLLISACTRSLHSICILQTQSCGDRQHTTSAQHLPQVDVRNATRGNALMAHTCSVYALRSQLAHCLDDVSMQAGFLVQQALFPASMELLMAQAGWTTLTTCT